MGDRWGNSTCRPMATGWKSPFPMNAGPFASWEAKTAKSCAGHQMKTAGQPAGLRLETDKPTLRNEWEDAAYLRVTVVDAEGTVVPSAAGPVSFTIAGPGAAGRRQRRPCQPRVLPRKSLFDLSRPLPRRPAGECAVGGNSGHGRRRGVGQGDCHFTNRGSTIDEIHSGNRVHCQRGGRGVACQPVRQ